MEHPCRPFTACPAPLTADAIAARAAARGAAPKAPARAGKAGVLRHLRLLRGDLLSAHPDHLFDAWMAEYRAPFLHSFLVNQPDLVAWLLAGADGAVVKSRRSRAALMPLLGRSAFCAEGACWAQARTAFDAALAPSRGRAALPAISDAADRLVAALATGDAKRPVDVEAAASRATLDIAFRLTFGRPVRRVEAGVLRDALARFRAAAPLGSVAAALPGLGIRGIGAGRRSRRAAADLHAVVTGALDTCGTNCVAGRLVASQGRSAARAQVALMLLAAHEGAGATLGWALWLLACCPDLQDRLAAEARGLPGDPRPSDLAALALTRDVVRETLRLYPPVPMVARETLRPLTLRGRHVPRGALITISPWHLHRHRRLWTAPDVFLPERWSAEGRDAPPTGAFLPFVAGPRGCPGGGFAMMEVTLLLARVVGALQLSPIAGRRPMPMARLTLRARDGIWLTAEPRADAAGGAWPGVSQAAR